MLGFLSYVERCRKVSIPLPTWLIDPAGTFPLSVPSSVYGRLTTFLLRPPPHPDNPPVSVRCAGSCLRGVFYPHPRSRSRFFGLASLHS